MRPEGKFRADLEPGTGMSLKQGWVSITELKVEVLWGTNRNQWGLSWLPLQSVPVIPGHQEGSLAPQAPGRSIRQGDDLPHQGRP